MTDDRRCPICSDSMWARWTCQNPGCPSREGSDEVARLTAERDQAQALVISTDTAYQLIKQMNFRAGRGAPRFAGSP